MLGPYAASELAPAREAGLELVAGEEIPDLSPSTSSSTPAWGAGGRSELRAAAANVVGVMTHLATADSDLAFARTQLERFRAATAGLPRG